MRGYQLPADWTTLSARGRKKVDKIWERRKSKISLCPRHVDVPPWVEEILCRLRTKREKGWEVYGGSRGKGMVREVRKDLESCSQN